MPRFFSWQALPGQGWPATAHQEQALVDELRRAATRTDRAAQTADYIAVLSLLRTGTTFAEAHSVLPGLDASSLLNAHTQLASVLQRSADAWNRIIANPTSATVRTEGPAASLLLAVPVERIERLLQQSRTDGEALPAIADVVAEVDDWTQRARQIERQLALLEPTDKLGIRLGIQLFCVAEPGMWTDPFFLPCRVGELSTRRAALLRHEVTR